MDYDHHDKVNGPEEQRALQLVLADIHSAAEADLFLPTTGVPRTENWREVVEDRGSTVDAGVSSSETDGEKTCNIHRTKREQSNS